MSLHRHSLAAYFGSLAALGKRENAVYYAVATLGRATDRQVLRKLFPGSDDCNRVRPRITGLCKAYDATTNPHGDWLEDCGEQRDPVTGRMVRVVRCLTPEARAERLLARMDQAREGQAVLL